MRRIPSLLILIFFTTLIPSVFSSPDTEQAPEKDREYQAPLAFKYNKVAVIYIHPRELRVANFSLNPFKNKLAIVEYDIGQTIEDEFAKALKDKHGIEALTGRSLDFEMVITHESSGKGYDFLYFKKLRKKLVTSGCEAALIIRSYPYFHNNYIGHSPIGLGYYRNKLPGKNNGRSFLIGNLEAVVYAPDENRHLNGSEPYVIASVFKEVYADPESWPLREKELARFLDETRLEELRQCVAETATTIVNLIDPTALPEKQKKGINRAPWKRWLN